MKNFVKMILPVAAFALASAGAVVTDNHATESKSGFTQGWKRISPRNCAQPVMCNNQPSVICTTGGANAKAYLGLDCTEELFHTVP